jgi:hypothetical protein
VQSWRVGCVEDVVRGYLSYVVLQRAYEIMWGVLVPSRLATEALTLESRDGSMIASTPVPALQTSIVGPCVTSRPSIGHASSHVQASWSDLYVSYRHRHCGATCEGTKLALRLSTLP